MKDFPYMTDLLEGIILAMSVLLFHAWYRLYDTQKQLENRIAKVQAMTESASFYESRIEYWRTTSNTYSTEVLRLQAELTKYREKRPINAL